MNNYFKKVLEIGEKVNDYIVEKTGSNKDLGIEMYLAGGAAVSFYLNERVSDDIDAVFSHRIILPSDLHAFYDDNGKQRRVSFDGNYNDTLSLMHPDYKEDAVLVKRIGVLTIKALNPEDLIISKLSRFAQNDELDIKGLILAGLVNKDKLEKRFNEACEYYIFDQAFVNFSLATVNRFFDELGVENGAVHEPKN